MTDIDTLANDIVAREGGFVNDPDDPGGMTKHGITLKTLARLGADYTGDGRTDAADLRALTRADAARLLVEHYYHRPRLDRLPVALQPPVFDMQVNAGATAVRILQKLLNELGESLAVDGAVGERTAAAAARQAARDPQLLADAYGIARRNHYYRLADLRPASRKYVRTRDGGKGGWILRAEAFLSPRFRLSDAEHAERCAQWG